MDTTMQAQQHATSRVVLVSLAAAMGGFLFGFDSAVINGAVDAVRGGFALDAARIGFAVSCALLGAALGAWYAGPVADRWGRVRTMQVAAVLLFASALGSGLVVGLWDLIAWRFVGGVGIGVASVIAPAYIAEVSPAHVRGDWVRCSSWRSCSAFSRRCSAMPGSPAWPAARRNPRGRAWKRGAGCSWSPRYRR